ncbi:MAG: hypothetical protein HDR24_02900 [Lachnospiraceae bacterium]|nr:hypothetical protein [Lachnospiraceae bacterium]
MDETEVAVKVEVHDHDIESLKYRVNDLESQSKAIQELAISVNRMAVSMENMLQELNRQGERLEVLERMPAETGKLVKTAIITALTGSIVGAMMTAILTLL